MPIFVKTEIIKKEYLTKKDIRNKIIKEHIIWIKRLKDEGIKIQSGFLVNDFRQPGAGGLLIIEIANFKAALNIIKNDPMITNNLVDWNLNEWIDISL